MCADEPFIHTMKQAFANQGCQRRQYGHYMGPDTNCVKNMSDHRTYISSGFLHPNIQGALYQSKFVADVLRRGMFLVGSSQKAED